MLPNELSSVYRQYKMDTDSVAAWLASTGKTFGYPCDLLASKSWDVPHPRIGRLKGKQRKQAKALTNANAVPEGHKYIVAINDFLPLANFIASQSNPIVSVPAVFSKTFDRLIKLRAGYGEMRAKAGAERDPVADETHDYFVGVLQAVRDALRPGMASGYAAVAAEKSAPLAKTPSSQTKAKHLGNMFAALNVKEPSQAFIEDFVSAPIERPKAQDRDPVTYAAEQLVSIEEIMFSFTMLMKDLKHIRSCVEWIWSNHQDGVFDLGAAAVATDVCTSFARGMIEEIEPLLSRDEQGAWGIVNKFFFLVCLSKGHTVDQIFAGGKDDFNYGLYELADEACHVSFRLLRSCVDVLSNQGLPLIKEGKFGHYNAQSDRTRKSGKAKYLEDQIIIMEIFTELMTVIRCVPKYPVEDELLRGMRVLEKTKTVPFSLVFAMQIQLDINHTMRAATRSSFRAMEKQTSVIGTHLQSYLDYHKNLRIENWPPSNDKILENMICMIKWMASDPVHQAKSEVIENWPPSNDKILENMICMIKWMASDPVHQAKSEVIENMGLPVSPQMERHRILLYSPVLAGLYLYRMRYEMWDVGIAIANAWGSITYTAHLYNALQSQKLLSEPWPDMDATISLLGEPSIWVGGERPCEIGDCFQKFCLQMGVTASAFTTNRRRKISLHSRAGPRGIKDGCPVSSQFTPQFISGAGSDMKWTSESIQAIISRSRTVVEESGDNQLVITELDDPMPCKQKTRERGQKGKPIMLSPGELVKGLVLALHYESLEMAFPYTLMHRWCWNLLRQLKTKCDPLLRKLYTPSYMEKENQLPWMIGYFLTAASGMGNRVQGPRLLKEAAGVFGDMMEAEAGEISMSVMEMLGFYISFEDGDSDDE